MSRAGVSDLYRAKSRKANEVFTLQSLFALTKIGENWDEKIGAARVKRNWSNIVGGLSDSIELVEIDDGVAKISTGNPTFATQLKLYEKTILDKINEYTTSMSVHSIHVVNPTATTNSSCRAYYRRRSNI